MRLLPAEIGATSCRLIIQAGADLSIERSLRWQVQATEPVPLPELFRRFDASVVADETFSLPESTKALIPLRFAIPDTVYPFTILYLWMVSNVDQRPGVTRSDDAANALVWYLRVAAPHLDSTEVRRIHRALDRLPTIDVGKVSEADEGSDS
ncbi:hypothetical protein [Micromonospora sp. SH-82]|uniref:hypothetical protein n=1 Tax=Micromonospora sp. SH-82 TaxID=3132938 RepID=UPI003EC14E43